MKKNFRKNEILIFYKKLNEKIENFLINQINIFNIYID